MSRDQDLKEHLANLETERKRLTEKVSALEKKISENAQLVELAQKIGNTLNSYEEELQPFENSGSFAKKSVTAKHGRNSNANERFSTLLKSKSVRKESSGTDPINYRKSFTSRVIATNSIRSGIHFT